MLQTLKNAFLAPDIRKKILFTLAIIFIYRIGCFIPVPGLDPTTFSSGQENDFMQMLYMITGGSLQNGTIFALGIIPFINSFIIMQLLTLVIPKLERLSKEGEEGRKQITQYTRYLAIGLGIIQAIGVMFSWRNSIVPVFGDGKASEIFTMICIVIILTAGSSLVMWLGERITEYGVGNGTSLIIFIGIVSSLGLSIGRAIINTIPAQIRAGEGTAGIWFLLAFLLLVVLLFMLIVFVDLSDRKITVQYAKQIKGNKMYGGQSTHIPIKVNSGGVMPIIFASSLIMFPQMIMQFVGNTTSGFVLWWYEWMGVGGKIYPLFMFLLIIFFAYFYSQIQFNPDDIARMIQQNGGFIPGIRPGKSTSDHLRKINNRITLFGALFLAFVAIIPTYILQIQGFASFGFANAFSATGLLIVVSVALEFEKQLESQLLVKHNKGFLK
ncbi:MAG: preprotein translocase subunit SecY [Bacillota bacterium]|jgi:preprotein translocase subunit SecY|nr:preprotein translocase subunit SecY [Bacillota bacterium]HHU43040.1 preprotein translocase subunit SecY [Clostridiales bacterium]